MSGVRGVLVSALLLWLAGALQMGLAPRIMIVGTVPDFGLVALACLALMASRRGGATIGFFAGVIQGAIVGANLAAYAVTRTIGGFGLGWFNDLDFEGNWLLAGVVAALLTVATQLMLMFGVHRGPLLPFLGGTLIEAVYNGVLAMPTYMVLRRLAGAAR